MTPLTRDRARAMIDAGGHLLAFERTEAANLATIDIAVQKPRTAVFFQNPTRYLTGALKPGGAIYTAQHTSGGLSPIPGGVPIFDADGVVIGAVSISGGSGEQDHAMATTAVTN